MSKQTCWWRANCWATEAIGWWCLCNFCMLQETGSAARHEPEVSAAWVVLAEDLAIQGWRCVLRCCGNVASWIVYCRYAGSILREVIKNHILNSITPEQWAEMGFWNWPFRTQRGVYKYALGLKALQRLCMYHIFGIIWQLQTYVFFIKRS